MPRQAFISHASADAQLALKICHGLESRGVRCWIAPRDVQADGTYGTEILKGLRECESFLIVVTDAAAESQQVEREAERASYYKKRIIPLSVDQNEPGPRLEFYTAGRQRFPCSTSPDDHFLDRLAEAVRGETVVRPTAPEPSRRSTPPWLWIIGAGVAAALAVAYLAGTFKTAAPPVSPESSVTPSVKASPPADPPTGTVAPPSGEGRSGTLPSAPPPATKKPDASPGRGAPATGRSNSPSGVPDHKAGDAAGSPSPGRSGGVTAAVVNGVRVSFVSVAAGSFVMGCSDGDSECEDDEKPVKRMQVDPFQMSATEVTQELWQSVTGRNPSDFKGASRPVEHISWQDSLEFVEKLNDGGGGFKYRLPTEAEWEYAARAGEPPAFELSARAWFGMADGSAPSPRPQPVGTKKPNRWGLYDMQGNVAEWCEDWYSPNYQRVTRGGSWIDSGKSLRLSARGRALPTTRTYSIGLRLVRTPQ